MRQSLLILRYSVRPWSKPIIAVNRNFPRSERAGGGRLSRGCHLRHQLGPLGRDLAVSRQPSACSKTTELRFEDLIRGILEATSLEKLRISSVEPMDWTDDLISLVARSPRIAKHAHVPLQSGSDAVLRRMHRKYRPWHYREKIEKIRAAMPTAAIGADVMVGFPGETAAEFEETRRLIEQLPFTYLHVFTYSARPGTPAASMANQVPAHTARERNRILRDIAAEKKLAFMHSFIGKTVEAITLGTCGTGTGHPDPRRSSPKLSPIITRSSIWWGATSPTNGLAQKYNMWRAAL